MRVVFAVVALVLVFLFWDNFRRTRSSYSGWWSLALLNYMVGSALFLLNGTVHQSWANLLGNALLVLGSASVWAGAGSLSGRRLRLPLLLAAPAATAIASLMDQRSDTWSGGAVFLAMMSLMIGMAAREMWRPEQEPARESRTLATAATLLSSYYGARCFVFVLYGPGTEVFQRYFGSAMTTVATLVLMVVVSHSMTMLSNFQLISRLEHIASRDALTGLLNRRAFTDRAVVKLAQLRLTGSPAALIMADLDDFKAINDTQGHSAGDRVLSDFAGVCTKTLRKDDLIGRYGGEEFILFLPGASAASAKETIGRINSALTRFHQGAHYPTVSYGVAAAPYGADPRNLNELIQAADAALYQAKSRGRNQAVIAPHQNTTS